MENTSGNEMLISHSSDITKARQLAKTLATQIGFDEHKVEEIVIVVSELVSNLVRHAKSGQLFINPINEGDRVGIKIESKDSGPGIADIEQALTDGFSTAGSLGYGLGTVNRLMDELKIISQRDGTHIMCKKWKRTNITNMIPCPLDFGIATRVHPKMNVNGDDFLIKHWNNYSLVAVIDGLGHGQFAKRAANTARLYIENHYDLTLEALFRGVGRACRATRGVVMAVARFEWNKELLPDNHLRLTFASVGNIGTRVFGSTKPMNFIVRRGVIGLNAPNPLVTDHLWDPGFIMVLHSDGLHPRWRWEDIPGFKDASATNIAQYLLKRFAKDDDDATVLVVKKA